MIEYSQTNSSMASTNTRFVITLIVALLVAASPVVMVINPQAVSAASPTPSTISQDGSEFTIQGAAGSTARLTNNIVNTFSYYDVVFKTSTAGTIKTIEIKFPAGTKVGDYANFIEAEGIGPGNAHRVDVATIVYTVNNAVNIPFDKLIRLEFSRILNPPTPSNAYELTVTTRDTAGDIIDGPTPSVAYPIKGIGGGDIANKAITSNKISSSFMVSRILQDGQNGWNPDSTLLPTSFIISDAAVHSSNSHVYISVDEPTDTAPNAANVVCMVEGVDNGKFEVVCDLPPAGSSKLRYTVINQP
jgi:hypothetical protein